MLTSQSPRVTVAIPVYNGASYLAQAIECMLAQTFRDFELILADNASTDATEAICRSYAAKDMRVRYCRSETNQGMGWNYNRTVDLARGEYFKWAACDDLCAPSFLQRMVQALDEHPAAAWCHSWTAFVDSLGKATEGPTGPAFRYTNQPGPGAALGPGRDASTPAARFAAVVIGPGECYDTYGLIRLSTLRRTRLQPACYGGDKVLLAELSLLGGFVEVPEVLFFSRVHPSQTTHTNPRKREHVIRGFDPGPVVIPRRLRSLMGYLRVIATSPISCGERLRCLLALARLCSSGWRWRRVLAEIRGSGLLRWPIHGTHPVREES